MSRSICLLLISAIPIVLAEPGLAALGEKCNEQSMVCQWGQLCSPETHVCIENPKFVGRGEMCGGKACKNGLICAKTKYNEPSVCQDQNGRKIVGVGEKCDSIHTICAGNLSCKGVCVPVTTFKVGEDCGQSTNSSWSWRCEDGSKCVSKLGDSVKCKRPEQKFKKESESCNHTDLKCDDGLLCLQNGSIAFNGTCQKPTISKKGGICGMIPFECESRLYCKKGKLQEGRCVKKIFVKEGEECNEYEGGRFCEQHLDCVNRKEVTNSSNALNPKLCEPAILETLPIACF